MSAELREGQQEYISHGFPEEGCIFRYETSIVQPSESKEQEVILRAISEEISKPNLSLDVLPDVTFCETSPIIPFIPLRHTFISLFELRQKQLKKHNYG